LSKISDEENAGLFFYFRGEWGGGRGEEYAAGMKRRKAAEDSFAIFAVKIGFSIARNEMLEKSLAIKDCLARAKVKSSTAPVERYCSSV
jgi:hypothetical protein